MTSSHTVALRPAIKTEPIPPHIVEEIETFEAEAHRVLAGDLSTDIFKPFRLQYGIYGQRQPGVQMFRIKIPFGGLTAKPSILVVQAVPALIALGLTLGAVVLISAATTFTGAPL